MDLKSIENSLLDISRMNNLINYKERVNTTVSVKNTDIDKIYKKLFEQEKIEVFNIDKYVKKFSGTTNLKESDVLYEDLIKQIKSEIKEDSIILYKHKGSVEQVLKNLIKKNKESKIERGLHILYISFGMFNYFEDKQEYKAPFILVPIDIVESSKVFKIILHEEEASLNPNFRHKLIQEYKMTLSDISLSDDFDSYLNKVNKKLESLDFNVSKESVISLFSFNKINMYYDMVENEKEIKNHNLVKALFNEENAKNAPSACVDVDAKIILDADHSQKMAIDAVRRGESIVLVGPPGTGKSQTITNIISSALYDKKKVLFVSEKLAALNVVYDKLKHSGFKEFLLPLHSLNLNKKDVIKDLYDTLYKEKTKTKKEMLDSLEEVSGIENLLDDYAKTLHEKIDFCGLSPYEIFSNLESYRAFENNILLDDKYLNKEYKDKIEDIFNDYKLYKNIIDYDYRKSPFYLMKDAKKYKKYSNVLQQFYKELSIIVKNITDVKKAYGFDIVCLNEYLKFYESYNIFYKYGYNKKEFFVKKNIDLYYTKAKKLLDINIKIDDIKNKYQSIFNENIKDANVDDLLSRAKKFEHKKFKFLRPSYKKFKKQIREYTKYKHTKLNIIIQGLNDVVECRNIFNEFNDLKSFFNDILKFDNINLINPNYLYKTIKVIKDNNIKYYKINKEVLLKEVSDDILNEFIRVDIFDIDINNYNLYELYKILTNSLKYKDYVDAYTDFKKRILDTLNSYDALKFLNYGLDKNINTDELKNVFLYSYYKKLKDNLFDTIPLFREYNIYEYIKLEEKFKDLDLKRLDINKSLIKEMVIEMKPNPDEIALGSVASIIRRENQKKRRQLSIREILSLNPLFIQTLKPVFLMSPLSVSTYLTSNIKFDLVIFDEASQIYPEDSIGAIYRSRQVVICGDPKQMPPTNFFKTQTLEDEEAETSLFESVLDMAKDNYKTYNLMWHYRSKMEELITFSNKYIYNNLLTTFAEANSKKEDMGLEFYKVDGIYDRTNRYNEIEAIKVCELVQKHYEKYQDTRSLGIVCFSISQQLLIERKLKTVLKDYKEKASEPLFVKNLETVQGDERDTIIISVGYGYSSDKKFIQNFGPLNKEGGERRLNVLISRAKINIKLVSSITSDDIKESKAIGANLLKKYIKFAQDTSVSLDCDDKYSNDFSMAVYNFLTENGYEAKYGLGRSKDKIDIAVKENNANDYAYAVECDGQTYKRACLTSDRYRLREMILNSRGFKYIRVSSVAWYKDNNLCKSKILEAMSSPCEKKYEEINLITEEEDLCESFKSYVYSPDEKLIKLYKNNEIDFEALIKRVLQNESPLNEEWFVRRYKEILKEDPYTEFELLKAMHLNNLEIISKDGYLISLKDEITLKVPSVGGVIRSIDNISPLEICYGMKDILIKNEGLEKEDLYKMILKLLGFKKMTKQIETKFDKALEEVENRFVVIKKDLKIKVLNI